MFGHDIRKKIWYKDNLCFVIISDALNLKMKLYLFNI